MEFLVIAYSILLFALTLVILGTFGKKADLKRKRLDAIEKEQLPENIYTELNGSFYSRIFSPLIRKLRKSLKGIVPKGNKNKQANANAQIEKQLRLAGLYIDPQEYNFAKLIVMVIVLVLTLIIATILSIDMIYKLLIILIGAVVAILIPTMFLRSRINAHQKGICRQLPDAMDMLGVCMEAGLSFDASLLKIYERMRGPFIDELMIVYREIQMGRSRRDAILNLASNSNIEELKTFASALAQAEKLGIPINNVLGVQSKQLRVERCQQAKEKGMKASIKMLIPMLLFVLPTIFIILLGPTVMNIIKQFS